MRNPGCHKQLHTTTMTGDVLYNPVKWWWLGDGLWHSIYHRENHVGNRRIWGCGRWKIPKPHWHFAFQKNNFWFWLKPMETPNITVLYLKQPVEVIFYSISPMISRGKSASQVPCFISSRLDRPIFFSTCQSQVRFCMCIYIYIQAYVKIRYTSVVHSRTICSIYSDTIQIVVWCHMISYSPSCHCVIQHSLWNPPYVNPLFLTHDGVTRVAHV